MAKVGIGKYGLESGIFCESSYCDVDVRFIDGDDI